VAGRGLRGGSGIFSCREKECQRATANKTHNVIVTAALNVQLLPSFVLVIQISVSCEGADAVETSACAVSGLNSNFK
jgi:hypothetical protein